MRSLKVSHLSVAFLLVIQWLAHLLCMDEIKGQFLNKVTDYIEGQIPILKAHIISIDLIYWKKNITQSFLLVILRVSVCLQISKDVVLSSRSRYIVMVC